MASDKGSKKKQIKSEENKSVDYSQKMSSKLAERLSLIFEAKGLNSISHIVKKRR